MPPLISVIVPTYNRSTTIGRTIDSILAQTYEKYEIIIVDDGSIDDTSCVLKKYTDNRIRIINHATNKGVTAAKNTGLNNIQGQWFTILDSDDEIAPKALELMIKVPLEFDSKVTAVSCNCIDTTTKKFSGIGLNSDQYLPFQKLFLECSGEFWGITKTDLLLNDRFNENLGGYEGTLWHKVYKRSNRYYLHQALRIYHTTGVDRVSTNFSLKQKSNDFQALSEESDYLEFLNEYQPHILAKSCLQAVIYLKADNKKEYAKFYFEYLNKMENYLIYKITSFFMYYSNKYLIMTSIKVRRVIK